MTHSMPREGSAGGQIIMGGQAPALDVYYQTITKLADMKKSYQ